MGKLQNLPEDNKKFILWSIIVVMAIAMGIFWIGDAKRGVLDMGNYLGDIKIPEIESPDLSPINTLQGIIDNIGEISVETENWKIYDNKKYGFSIKYPENWTYREYIYGASFFPISEKENNETGNGAFNIGFYKRGLDYCDISFEKYIEQAGPLEIQNYQSIQSQEPNVSMNGIIFYKTAWNYKDMQGLEKISLPITYFDTEEDNCGTIEAFLNDINYLDIYNKSVFTFNFVKQ